MKLTSRATGTVVSVDDELGAELVAGGTFTEGVPGGKHSKAKAAKPKPSVVEDQGVTTERATHVGTDTGSAGTADSSV